MTRGPRHARALLALAAALAACASPMAPGAVGSARRGVGGAAGSGDLVPLTPPGATAEEIGSPRAGALRGRVALERLRIPELLDNAAYRLRQAPQGLAALPARRALVRLTTLRGGALLRYGEALTATTDAEGRFEFDGGTVPSTPFVAEVALARGHVLAALVMPDRDDVVVDEATSMVLALLRWRAAAPDPLAGLDAAGLDRLVAGTRALLPALAAPDGATDAPAFQAGSDAALRGAYVRLFGARATPSGDTPADRLSDAWKALLGVRPLALAHVGPVLDRRPRDGGTLAEGLPPMGDLAVDADGSLFFTATWGGLGLVPAADRAAFWGQREALRPDHVYPVLGLPEAGVTPTTGSGALLEAAARGEGADAPADPGFALEHGGDGVLVEPSGGPIPHVYVALPRPGAVLLAPGRDLTRFGRAFRAGRVYVVAGGGAVGRARPGAPAPSDDPATIFRETEAPVDHGDGGPALGAPIAFPQDLARDAAGNLYVAEHGNLEVALRDHVADAVHGGAFENADAAPGLVVNRFHGLLRVVRAADGRIASLRPTLDGKPITLDAAADLRVARVDGREWLYLANVDAHYVFRVPVPDVARLGAAPTPVAAEVVLGAPGEPGLLAPAAAKDPAARDPFALARPRPAGEVRLRHPSGLDLDPRGALYVGDRNGVWRVAGGRAQLLAGGVASSTLEGDARLAAYPTTRRVRWGEATRDLYLLDGESALLRRIRLAREDAAP